MAENCSFLGTQSRMVRSFDKLRAGQRAFLFASIYKKWYNWFMYNWTVDEKILKKSKEKYAVWKLEQLVNFGLNGEKIKAEELKKYWNKLQLDPARKRFLELLLYG